MDNKYPTLNVQISPLIISEWLEQANDEEFVVALVGFWKRFRGDYSPLTKQDVIDFDIDFFIEKLDDMLRTIINDTEICPNAWWKRP